MAAAAFFHYHHYILLGAKCQSVFHTAFDIDARHLIAPAYQRGHFVVSHAVIEQGLRLVEHIRAIQHHAHQLHALPFRGENQAAPGCLGIACFHAVAAVIIPEDLIFIFKRASHGPGLRAVILGRSDLPEGLVLHGRRGDEGKIIGCGVMRLAVQAVWGDKMRIHSAQLPGSGVHQAGELLHPMADMDSDGHSCVISGG